MQITWFGHSAFRLDFAGHAVLIDPFFTGNPAFVSDKAAAIKGVSHIVLTHGHSDHVGDTLDIAKTNGATVTANYDLGMWLVSKGLEKLNPMNAGGTTDLGGLHASPWCVPTIPRAISLMACRSISAIRAASSSRPRASRRSTIIGDTDIFSDMALIAEIYQPQVAFVPIGDRFTMQSR